MAHGSDNEIEIKLRVADVALVRRRLASFRARHGHAVHEANVLFDFADSSLRSRGMLLRLRVEWPAGRGPGPRVKGSRRQVLEARMFPTNASQPAIVTFKGPVAASTARTGRRRAAYKIRREIELTASDARTMRQVLEALGLRPSFYYEKIRTTYRLPRVPGLVITLDETPVGAFLELEGRPTAIDRARRALGYQSADAILESYGALYLQHCRARGVRPGDMLFQ
jgi:adenylate cyclase, class 2